MAPRIQLELWGPVMNGEGLLQLQRLILRICSQDKSKFAIGDESVVFNCIHEPAHEKDAISQVLKSSSELQRASHEVLWR